MKITFCKRTALYVLRSLRRKPDGARLLSKRCDLVPPDLGGHARWSRKRLLGLLAELGVRLPERVPIEVAVPERDARLQLKSVSNTVYGSRLPAGSFIDLGGGVAISGPELLFAEMARDMTEAGHLMFGHELCGSFTRDPDEPINGDVTMGVPSLSSVERIGRFLSQAGYIRGSRRARESFELLADNAWSPTESVVATMAALPAVELGYELDPLVLNRRYDTPDDLFTTTDKNSRVPDIVFGETGVGINYDGAVHLDLDSVAEAGRAAALNPGDESFAMALKGVMRKVRAKAVDDIRRNRELAADGLTVFPVVKEDLYERGALDAVMLQVIACIERQTGRDLGWQRKAIADSRLRDRRQRLIWSLLPGSRGGIPDTVTVRVSESDTYAMIGF